MKLFKLILAVLLLATPASAQLLVDVGSSVPYTDTQGNVWSPDTGLFNVGNVSGACNNHTVTGTPDPNLFKSARWGPTPPPEMAFTLNVPNGSYTANLLFVECNFNAAGKRIFSVTAQGTTVITSLDIFAAVGQNVALTKTVGNLTVTNGKLVIGFIHQTENPIISGIQLIAGDTQAPVVMITVPAARTATTPSLVTATVTDNSAGPLAVTGTVDGVALPLPTFTGSVYTFASPDLNLLGVGVSHYVSVTAKDPSGNTGSASVNFVNAVITSLTAVPAAHSVTLSWAAPTTGATPAGFRIYRWSSGTMPSQSIAQVLANVLTYVDNAVTNNTTYSYAVTTTDANGNESSPAGPITAIVPAL